MTGSLHRQTGRPCGTEGVNAKDDADETNGKDNVFWSQTITDTTNQMSRMKLSCLSCVEQVIFETLMFETVMLDTVMFETVMFGTGHV